MWQSLQVGADARCYSQRKARGYKRAIFEAETKKAPAKIARSLSQKVLWPVDPKVRLILFPTVYAGY